MPVTGSMRIVNARWAKSVNLLQIKCTCEIPDFEFEHRADRWNVQCPNCGAKARLGTLREQYVANCQREAFQ